MQSSCRSEGNPQYAILATLLAILSILLFFALRDRRRKARQLFLERNERALAPQPVMSLFSRSASSAVPPPAAKVHREVRSMHFPTKGRRKNILLSAAAVIAALAIILTVVVTAFLAPGQHSKPSEAHFVGLSPVSSAASTPIVRSGFEKGIIFPRWFPSAYGSSDTTWTAGVQTIKTQTAAQWIEIPILFAQATSKSTTIGHSQSTPSVDSFSQGVQTAHKLGYKVFLVPLMSVHEPGGWSGSINITDSQQQQAWFDSYWNVLKPYVQAAAANNVEQMAIGTELQRMQQVAPSPLWNQLIVNIRDIFKKTLTYDINWSSLAQAQPDWLKNPDLAMIGVSSYIPLTNTAQRIDPQNMPSLWQSKVRAQLDSLAQLVGKPVLISEIGYRDTSDALYQTWESHSNAALDTQEQAGAFEAALSNVFADTQIAGIFFWGWDDVDQFSIKDKPAAQVLQKWYGKPVTLRQSWEHNYA